MLGPKLPYRLTFLGFLLGALVFQFLLIGAVFLRDYVGLPSGLIDVPILCLCLAAGFLPYLGIAWLHRRIEPGPMPDRL